MSNERRRKGEGNWGKPGRPPITQFVPAKLIIANYIHYGSANKAAVALKLHHTTVKKVLEANGFKVDNLHRHTFDSSMLEVKDTSLLADWIRSNPGRKLPHSVKEISEVTGLSYDTVRCYLYRRRKRLKRQIAELPPVTNFDLLFEDTLGKQFETGEIAKFTYKYRPHDLRVSIIAELKDGRITEAEITNFGKYRKELQVLARKHKVALSK